jgi:uncharacterized membrane protein YbhN (UPF0104 family)
MVPSGLFFLYAGAIVVLLARWSRGGQLGKAARLLPRGIRQQLATAPPGIARDRKLFAECFFFELAVFALDALTLWLLLFAVGSPLPFGRTLSAFMIATLARTMGLVPGGLGTFEAASVAALKLWGVPLVSALAATLLFRGYSFWLPMLPGLLLARRESRGAERPGR